VVGDFDSLGYVPDAADVREFPSEKDESDMELACRLAVDAGCDELVLYGCLGRRLDHTLANLQVMLAQARAGKLVRAVGDSYAVAIIHAQPGKPGVLEFAPIPLEALSDAPYRNYVSVLAIGGSASGVYERGMKYSLAGATMRDDRSWGLSNEFTGEPVEIRVESGSLLVTFPLAAWDYAV
jgi:thiamine pyrophosphokinase